MVCGAIILHNNSEPCENIVAMAVCDLVSDPCNNGFSVRNRAAASVWLKVRKLRDSVGMQQH